MKSPLLGAHSVARSLNLADQQCINLYPRLVDTKDGKDVGALYMTPGLDLLATIGAGPVRGAYPFAGLLYVVSGNGLYQVDTSWNATLIGTLTTSIGQVSFIDNGPFAQMMVVDGFAGYLWANSRFSVQPLPFSNPRMLAYQDDFGFAFEPGGQKFYQSAPGDLSSWPDLFFSSADGSSDNNQAIVSIHRELWILKDTHTEVWVNAGITDFAFQRLDGIFLEEGCSAPWSVAKAGDLLFWLSQDETGRIRVIEGQGYSPVPVSSDALEVEMATYSTISDAIGFVYDQEGVTFYMLTFPTAGTTWSFDIGTRLWHKRAAFVNGQFVRHPANCYASFNGRCVVGDYSNGNLYAFNLANPTDNGAQRRWLRTWRALPKPSQVPMRFNELMIDMQTGIGVPDGTSPNVSLRWSDDGGHNWSEERIMPAGRTGETARRVRFTRLGSTKKNAGLDRIFELSSADAFDVALIGAYVS